MKHIFYSIALTCVASVCAAQSNNGKLSGYQSGNQKAAQPVFHQGDDPLPATAMAGYNAPGGVMLKGDKGWMFGEVFVDASFIYYNAQMEGLALGTSASAVGADLDLSTNSTVLMQENGYKPGFQVGFGGTFDEWMLRAEYTWIRNTQTTNSTAPAPDAPAGTGVWVNADWFLQYNKTADTALSGTNMSSTWKLGMDLVDLVAGRPYYQSRNGVVSPFFGLRAAWIRNTVDVDMDLLSTVNDTGALSSVSSLNHSHSWALGARGGADFHWLVGGGFRVEGKGGVSVLYTDYTTVKHSEGGAFAAVGGDTYHLSQNGYGTVRPELDLSLGLGWGSYFSDDEYHLDFSADYDFLVFWGQNMIRRLLDEATFGTSGAAGELLLQGFRFTARFDF